MPIFLSDIFAEQQQTEEFRTNALERLREVTVDGTDLDSIILSSAKDALTNKDRVQSTLEIFLRDLDNNSTLVDTIILQAVKVIIENPIEDQRLYDRLLVALTRSAMTREQFDLFNNKVKVGGSNNTVNTGETPDTTTTTTEPTPTGENQTTTTQDTTTGTGSTGSNATSQGTGSTGTSTGTGVTPFPETQQIRDNFIETQANKFDSDLLTSADFNTTIEKSYVSLLGQTEYDTAREETYELLFPTEEFNSLVILAFVPILDQRYFNENLMTSLSRNVDAATYDTILRDIIRDRIAKERPIKKNLLDIYLEKINSEVFNKAVAKSREPEEDKLTFVILLDQLNLDLPVYVGVQTDLAAGSSVIRLARDKIQAEFGLSFYNRFFKIDVLLNDLSAALNSEIGDIWTANWIRAKENTNEAVNDGQVSVAFMEYTRAPLEGVGANFPNGSQIRNYFTDEVIRTRYGRNETVRILTESIIEYLSQVYPLFDTTCPQPYLASPFGF